MARFSLVIARQTTPGTTFALVIGKQPTARTRTRRTLRLQWDAQIPARRATRLLWDFARLRGTLHLLYSGLTYTAVRRVPRLLWGRAAVPRQCPRLWFPDTASG